MSLAQLRAMRFCATPVNSSLSKLLTFILMCLYNDCMLVFLNRQKEIDLPVFTRGEINLRQR
jgi:hypothetical protein